MRLIKQGITMGKFKTKAIVVYSDISKHIQRGIIRNIQNPCVALTYSEPWYIQNLSRALCGNS